MLRPLGLGSIGLTFAILGALAVVASLSWPAADDEVATASAADVASDEPSPEVVQAPWRDALLVGGTICGAAGAGLLVLALLPRRPDEA